MPTRKAEAEWEGNLAEGGGKLKVGRGAFEGPYSFKSRFEEGEAGGVAGRSARWLFHDGAYGGAFSRAHHAETNSYGSESQT